jgi:hypothetical protein
MTDASTRQSDLIVARLRDPSASSDQFTWDELQKVYVDRICLRGGTAPYLLVFATFFAGAWLCDRTGLSLGWSALCAGIALVLVAGGVLTLLAYRFARGPKDAAFERLHHWATTQLPQQEAKSRSTMVAIKVVTPLLLVGIVIAAAMTLPDEARHEAELRQAITVAINSTEARSGSEVLGKAAAWVAHEAFKDDRSASYIDFLGLQYRKFFIVSLVMDKDQVVSVGIFNQVYVRDLAKFEKRK